MTDRTGQYAVIFLSQRVDADEDGMGDMRIISKALTVFFGKTIFFNNDIGQFDGI